MNINPVMIGLALAGWYLATRPPAVSATSTGTAPTGADILREVITSGPMVSASEIVREHVTVDPWAGMPPNTLGL